MLKRSNSKARWGGLTSAPCSRETDQARPTGKANGALMEALRGKLSVLLRTAHAKGLLPWACALHDEFRAEGTAARVYIDLDVEDE